jgi:hypothetical protein
VLPSARIKLRALAEAVRLAIPGTSAFPLVRPRHDLEQRVVRALSILGGVTSFDPQAVFFVPVLDRQFGITLEAVVIWTDLRFDPARFVAQQQMHTRRRFG